MFMGITPKNGRGLALSTLGALLLACSGIDHDCSETRDCPEPDDTIDVGGGDEWWNPGAAGQTEPLAEPSESGAAGARAADASGAAGEGATAPAVVLAGPGVMNVMPADGAIGVARETALVVTFTEAMDPSTTEAAYRSDDLPRDQLVFSWDDSHTSLTLTPLHPLVYASGAAEAEVTARMYHYGFAVGALARAGRALPAITFTFSTLRQLSKDLPADAERTGNWTNGGSEGIHNCLRHPKAPYLPTVCVGDDPNGVRYVGFLSFDLSPLPDDITHFFSVRLVADATTYGSLRELGPNLLEQVPFDELAESALAAAASAPLGPFYTGKSPMNGDHFELDDDVTNAVADDYAQRDVRASRSQYRLSFGKVSANAHWDDVELPTSTIHLSLTYLEP